MVHASLLEDVADGFVADGVVERLRGDLGVDHDSIEAVRPGHTFERFHELAPDAAAAIGLEDGDAFDPPRPLSDGPQPRRADGIPVRSGDCVDRLAVAVVVLEVRRDALLLDEDAFAHREGTPWWLAVVDVDVWIRHGGLGGPTGNPFSGFDPEKGPSLATSSRIRPERVVRDVMERRRFLTAMGTSTTAGVVCLAGCGSPGGDGGDDTPGGTGDTPGNGTPTQGETAGDGTATEEGTTAEGTAGGGATADAQAVTVDMITEGDAYYFDPIGVAVPTGASVTWVNDSGSHTSTAYTQDNPQSETRRIPEGAEGWDSGFLSEGGAEFSHTFETEGTYDYYCTPHKSQGMVGRVVVGEPGGPGDEGQPPDGELPASADVVDQGSIGYQDFQG